MKRFIALFVGIYIAVLGYAVPRGIERVKIGDRLPYFSVTDQNGDAFCSDNLIKPTLVVFFHTRCYDCRKELPVLQDIYEYYGQQIQIICISRAEAESTISSYWCSNKLALPFSAQEDKRVFKLFADRVIPRVYLVDSSGIVRAVFVERFKKRKLNKAIQKEIQRNNKI